MAGGKGLLLSALIGRMYYLQVVEQDRYRTLSDKNRISVRIIPPRRGRITDRNGKLIAINNQNYRLSVIPEDTEGRMNEVLHNLAKILPLSESDIRSILRKAKRSKSFLPISIIDNLTWQHVAQVEVNTPSLPGILIEAGYTRFYPFREKIAHILGYVGAPKESQLGDGPMFALPDFRVGKTGIEKKYDDQLIGQHGTKQVEINAQGREIREISRNDGKVGNDLRLSIDQNLQIDVSKRLLNKSAAAVVMNVHTGEVLAMASSPSYDPNKFVNGLSNKAWQQLLTDPLSPLTNKAIAGVYAPGSTFKTCVGLAALETQSISPTERVYCPGYYDVGKNRFHCWKRGGHGHVNMHEAIQQSCDVYFYEVAKRTGIDSIGRYAKALGLNQVTGIDLPGESSGLIPSKDWKRATIGSPWLIGETIIAGIGQGYVLTTPLQLATMTARLCNGGHYVRPTLKITSNIEHAEPLGFNFQNLNVILSGMSAVTNTPRGTAFRARIQQDALQMAGKSGTAQVRRISKNERQTGVIKNDDLDWEMRDHALFVGFAPILAPKYCAAVVIEHGGSGSNAAAPIVRDLLSNCQMRNI